MNETSVADQEENTTNEIVSDLRIEVVSVDVTVMIVVEIATIGFEIEIGKNVFVIVIVAEIVNVIEGEIATAIEMTGDANAMNTDQTETLMEKGMARGMALEMVPDDGADLNRWKKNLTQPNWKGKRTMLMKSKNLPVMLRFQFLEIQTTNSHQVKRVRLLMETGTKL